LCFDYFALHARFSDRTGGAREEAMSADAWPALPYEEWRDTRTNLQLRTQIVGKIRLAQIPWINHSWHVTLYLTARGMTTGPIEYHERVFQIDFDFIDHRLLIHSSDGRTRFMPLREQTVADFYAQLTALLAELGFAVRINLLPNEVSNPIPFNEDHEHRAYDPAAVQRFWRVLQQVDRVFTLFRSGFIGKVSPVHFFWGSFDLAVTRFSGRPAPLHRGGAPGLPDAVVQEAYSHEVSSAGFWPGDGVEYAAFYSYAYPEPAGFASFAVRPDQAFYHEGLGEFVLPYDAVRTADSPDETLLSFLQTTYEAAARCAHWDRALECSIGIPGVPRPL
jgi:hypothetical protein